MSGPEQEEEGEKLPVNALVKKLREVTDGVGSVCKANTYHGQALRCCEGIQTCFITIEESFTTVKSQAIGNQNMHKACRRLKTDFEATNSCIVSWTGNCHSNVDTEQLMAPFQSTLNSLKTLLDEHCSDLSPEESGKPNHPSNNRPDPSEQSTTSTSTSDSSTTSSTPTSEQPVSTSSTSDSSISPSHAASTPRDGSNLTTNTHPELESDNTIIIISSTVGSILFLCVIVLGFFIMYKKRQQKNTESGGSFEPDGKPKFFSWLFNAPKNPGSVQTDTEIYAEIDEAFMEAVYKFDKEKPPISRDRISSNSHFNVCYESGLNDDNIITSKDKLNTIENDVILMEPLSPLALIRKEDDAITSFQTGLSRDQDKSSIENAGPMNRRGFLTRRLGFTDIASDSSGGDYVYIETQENDNVFQDVMPSEYDTAEYGRNPNKNIPQAPEENHYSYIVYNNDQNAQQSVKEYRRSSSDVETHVYENQDTLMEY